VSGMVTSYASDLPLVHRRRVSGIIRAFVIIYYQTDRLFLAGICAPVIAHQMASFILLLLIIIAVCFHGSLF